MPASFYHQLTGKRRVYHTFTQLFLGPDHLLLMHSSRFEERYQRFFYKDIQALVVTALPNRTWMQVSLGVLSAALFLVAATLISIAGWRVVLGMVAVIPALVALVDYFRGQRCRMILKTPVSNETLPAVSRMSTAALVISRLKPAIELVQQGEWTAEMTPASGPPVMAPAVRGAVPANRLILGLFTLVTINAGIFAAARLSKRNEFALLLVYSVFTEIVLGIAQQIAQLNGVR